MQNIIIIILLFSLIGFYLYYKKKKENIKEKIKSEIFDQECQKIRQQAEASMRPFLEEEQQKLAAEQARVAELHSDFQKDTEHYNKYIADLKKNIEAVELSKQEVIDKDLARYKEMKISQIKRDIEEEKEKQALIEKQTAALKEYLDEYHKIRISVGEDVLRQKEKLEKEDFYKINISDNDIADIKVLESIKPQLRKQEAICKLIWDLYIQRPTNEMIKRITGNRTISGIYKIMYIPTGEIYIGKTTNIKTRWTNHVKTAIGLDGAAHATLHTRMEKDGLWNYTFEILEEVDKEKLTEREKYYIKLYDSVKQLNMREG